MAKFGGPEGALPSDLRSEFMMEKLSENITLRLPLSTRQKLDGLARALGGSRGDVVRRLIEKARRPKQSMRKTDP